MLRFQVDAWATEGKLFLTFFPDAQRKFAGPEDRLFVGGDEEECLPALSVIRQAEGIAFDAEEVAQVGGEEFAAFLVASMGLVAAPVQYSTFISEYLEQLPLNGGVPILLIGHAHLRVIEHASGRFDFDRDGMPVLEADRHVSP